MRRASFSYAFAALLLATASGCVRESSDGSSHAFSYQFWLPLIIMLGGIVAMPAGWFLRSVSGRLGFGLLILGPIGALGFAPSLFLESTKVDQDAFTVRSGIWGMTACHCVKYDDVRQVRIVAEQVRGRRGSKRTNYYLVCERKDGGTDKVGINNDVTESAAPHILQQMTDHNVPIVNETGI